ncbi:MAG: SLBB domain-containing protein [Kiritimatiellae bacterium]|nr:SLBB domain-containing protein [Kiritimatiellia bacterium]
MRGRRTAYIYTLPNAGRNTIRFRHLPGLVAMMGIVAGCLTAPSAREQVSPYRPSYEGRDILEWMSRLPPPAVSASNFVATVTGETNGAAQTVSSTNETGTTEAKRLRVGMPVRISLLGITPAAEIRDVIDSRGEVTLPYIGNVRVEGLTTDAAESLIEQKYVEGGIYRKINVIVIYEEEPQFFVRGEVKNEGRYLLKGEMTLLKAITAAGGYTEYADRRKVRIIRGTQILVFDCEKIDKGKAEDPAIKENDIIVVPRRWV